MVTCQIRNGQNRERQNYPTTQTLTLSIITHPYNP